MTRSRTWLAALAGSFLFVAGAAARPPAAPTPVSANPAAAPTEITVDDPEMRRLLEKLNLLTERITKDTQSPDAWRTHLEEGAVLLQIAARSKPDERDNWVRMAADSYYSAAVISPETERSAAQRLAELPGAIARTFPGSPVIAYAALQEIQADCTRFTVTSGGDANQTQGHRRDRLLRFAQEYPASAEAPKAVLEAGQLSEQIGKTDDARTCYHYLADHFPASAQARKVGGALWRLGQDSEPMQFELPLLYSDHKSAESIYNIAQLRGQIVVVYFWSSAAPGVAEEFAALKQVTDRFRSRGLEVLYVNLDANPAQGQDFLSGRLTAGEHLYQGGGLDGPVAERYGIHNLPEAFLLHRDGTVIRHSLKAADLEKELTALLPRGR
jgi:hypothetical protein